MSTSGSSDLATAVGVGVIASAKNFSEIFDVAGDPDEVVIEFQHSRVAGHSAIEAIDTLTERYIRAGKHLSLRHLSPERKGLLHKARHLVEVNVQEDPRYHTATDERPTSGLFSKLV